MPVAAPISGRRRRRRDGELLAAATSAAYSGVWSKPGSLCVVALLRWLRRGAATASGSDIPKSRRLTRICSTVVMIVAPPGEPSARNGLPLRSTIVGAIDERGRLPRCDLVAPADAAGVVPVGVEVEVGQLVVEQEAVAGHDHAVAAGLLDRERVVDDVAPRSVDGQVRRRADARRSTRCVSVDGASGGSPAGDRARSPRSSVISARALRRRTGRTSSRASGTSRSRVAEVGAAVGEGQRARPRGSGAARCSRGIVAEVG